MNRKPLICPVCSHAMTEDESKGYLGCPNTTAQKAWLEGDRLSPMPPPRIMHVAQHHRRRIFSLSLGDWLDAEVPIEWLSEMLDTIRQCDKVVWILCSKRPENFFSRLLDVQSFLSDNRNLLPPHLEASALKDWIARWLQCVPPKNVILLTSVENQATADVRIPQLLAIPAACRGLSLEPLLGSVDLSAVRWTSPKTGNHPCHIWIDWIIIGGESGPTARPCNVDWIRSLVAQGKAAGCSVFVKQLGAKPVCDCSVAVESFSANCCQHFPNPIRDKKGGEISEWPQDLQVQQWPEGLFARVELKKHNLACFCKTDQKCHCDELLKIANAKSDENKTKT
jgi:protein gp37